MSYYKSKNKSTSQFSRGSGFLTASQIVSLINQVVLGGSDFYEFEEAEVLEVLLEEENLPTRNDDPDFSYIGAVRARMVNSETNTILSSENETDHLYKPLDLNNMRYPLVGEYVTIVSYLGQSFYTNIISHRTGINHNVDPGRSMPRISPPDKEFEEDFIEIPNIRPVKVKSGDVVFQGRYGNSIHFSSDDDGLPTIKIRAGQSGISEAPNEPVEENLADDKSSVWIEPTGISIKSDRIIFRSGEVTFGPEFDNQPLVLGQLLVDILGELIDAINTMTHPTGVGPSGPPINATQFTAIKNKLETLLTISE